MAVNVELRRSSWRLIGLILAIASVVAPALPLGPLAASPPLPLAALWLAYGWAREGETGLGRPMLLFVFGIVHDLLGGTPIGFMAGVYLVAYLLGAVAGNATRSFSAITDWVGFGATAAATLAFGAFAAQWALGGAALWPILQAGAVTILLFPLVRRFYVSRNAMTGAVR